VTWARAAAAATLLLLAVSPAGAQTRVRSRAPHAGSVEAGVGGVWVGGVTLGQRQAQETRNPGTGGGPLVLFVTENRLDPAAGVQARLGVYLSKNLVVEAGIRYSRPVFVTRVTDDFEEAPDAMAKETLSQYLFDGSVVLHVAHFSGGRVVPFVQAGAGHLRDLHERGELLETGVEYHGGGGVKLWLGGRSHRIGIRADAAVSSRKGGFDLKDERRMVPVAAAIVMFVF
jgi:hypothetical protein